MELLKPRYMLDKYRIDRRIARGAFANVYRAYDTIEGVRVALKIPHPHLMTGRALGDFRHEVRVMARLDHPNILPIKNASFIGERFVIVYPLGERSLAERLTRRMSLRMMVCFAEQMLSALAHAHARRIIHCDVKPENFILFPENRLRLADFEIAKIAMRTVKASGEGTIGYVAPEQAMGRPTFQSDVFSAGLILYRMMSGKLPEWPYDWPPPAFERLRRQHPDVIAFLRRALEIAPEKRFPSAVQMLAELRRLRHRVLNHAPRRRRRASAPVAGRDWKELRLRQFSRQFGKALDARHACRRCGGPVSEAMSACPWCATRRDVHREGSRFPASCPRCRRGMKLDWRFCPWCFGGEVGPRSDRRYTDVRYAGRCGNPSCPRGQLMPFMRYCPWCRRKVHRPWKIEGTSDRCASCGWGVAGAYWDFCPWCASRLRNRVAGSRA
jgi:serine/threonine-protein kinase